MELTPQQWETVKALFEEALEKSAAERHAFVAAHAGDDAVQREVERLLAHNVESGGFLSQPVLQAASPTVSSTRKPSFSPGEVISARFRIVRFLARGGMGEVYEAEDIELHERVALKSIRSELLDDAKALERFKREVHLARKVTHPNICRTFDFYRHTFGEGPNRATVAFVAMELLEGESLADLLRRTPRMQMEALRPIASQMASGLGAAHAAGVLHRDFKPGNVLLVPGAKRVRAVITDFGLALRSKADASMAPVTGAGEVLGTPEYMSPEQVEARELTPASDVYSLGLVLYQMITGARAFEDATPLSTAVRRIKQDPIPPRRLVPDVDRQWESLVLKCLARDPKNRYQSGEEVAEAIRSLGGPRQGKIRPRWIVGFVAALVAVVLGFFVVAKMHRLTAGLHPQPALTIAARPSIAVLPFHNLSGRGDTDWVSTALPEILTAELAAGGKLRTLSGENIARASTDLGLTGKQTLASDTLSHVRNYLGSDYVVLGSYLDQGSGSESQIRLDLWLQDTRTGETTATVSEKGSESDLDDLATRAGVDLRSRLGIGEITPGEAAAVRAALPSNPEAVRLYSEGLTKLRLLDSLAARDLLERAVTIDPNYALGHAALAASWEAMGYDGKAREESKKARDVSSGLSREERLWIEGRDWELNRKWDKATEIYRTLFDFFPDNIEYGLRLAAAQRQGRSPDESLKTLASLRRLPAPDNSDPRIDLQQADVYDIKGAYKEQQASAEAAANRARNLGAQLLLARALNQEARAYEKQGKLDDALRCTQEAANISDAAGQRAEVAKALTITGIVHFDQGNFAEAASAYNRALSIQREIGDKRSAATTLNDLANALGEQGDLAGSITMLNEALLTFQEVGDKHSAAAVLGSIAARTLQQGNLAEGKKMLEEGLAASRELGDQERTSTALYNLGEVLLFKGDLKGARRMYGESESVSKQIGDQSGVAYALFSLGDVATAEADLSGARQKYNESMALRTQMGEKGNIAETQMALAALDIEAGHFSDADKVLQQAHLEFHQEGLGDDEILADVLLARESLAQGKPSDAQSEISASQGLLGKSQGYSERLRASIEQAEVQAAIGKQQDALRILRETVAKAKKSGYLGYQLEAELALGEVEKKFGEASAALNDLSEARRVAQQKRFLLIAGKAARDLKQ